MDAKQLQIRDLVLAYFRQRSDTELDEAQGGMVRVRLISDIAQLDFGRQERELRLVFDADTAYLHPGSELVRPGHPFLEIIRNELERDSGFDPHLSEASLVPQLISPAGTHAVPGLAVSGAEPQVSYRIDYAPLCVLTYRILYEGEERSENIVRRCYDLRTGAPRHDLIALLEELTPVAGKPEGARAEPLLGFAALLAASRREIEALVTQDAQVMGGHVETLLSQERKRLTEFYQAEAERLSPRDSIGREQVQATLAKDVAELERKLSYRVSIDLLSILRLWWPTIDYRLAFEGRRGTFEVSGIRFEAQSGTTSAFHCGQCGNETHYDICVAHQHVLCGGTCSRGLERCATCGDSFCPEHGHACSRCCAPACDHDGRLCEYGSHAGQAYICPACRVQSFEDRVICRDCLEVCPLCQRAFPHERMATCRVGCERVCVGHRLEPDAVACMECSEPVCRQHGAVTADRKWACRDHVAVTTCCARTFGRSSLTTCIMDTSEALCPDHRRRCEGCGGTVCEQHSQPLTSRPEQYVCESCRRTCERCGSDHSYLQADLQGCHTCGQQVCTTHRRRCVVGREVVCDAHAYPSVDGEWLCQRHVGRCAQCQTDATPRIHRTDRLQTCVVCKQQVCVTHQVVCPTCQRTVMCSSHQASRPTCASCGHVSCGTGGCHEAGLRCHICGMQYCAQCVDARGYCSTCLAVKETAITSEWLTFLRQAMGQADAQTAAVFSTMLEKPTRLHLWTAANRTFQVVVVRHSPAWYQYWKAHQQARIVVAPSSGIVRVFLEKPAG